VGISDNMTNKTGKNLKKKILLIANGEAPPEGLVKRMVDWSELVVAIDGGANQCAEWNVTPDFIVGDLDSVTAESRDRFYKSEIVYLPDQNKHDFEKALEFIETLTPKEVRVLCGWGKRFDHILANLYVMLTLKYSFNISFFDAGGELSVIKKKIVLSDAIGKTISLFSFHAVYGLSIEGCKYRIEQPDFPGGFIGLSNVITGNPATIRLNDGYLILYRLYEKD
jgi:thiamine pyrophosphokinase